MSHPKHVLPMLLLAALAPATVPSTAAAQDSTVTAWMKRHAQPFATCEPSDRLDDLKVLRDLVGNARIVALGEGTHGTREFFQLKHRITQYLASEMGFTVFAIEANLPEAWKLNDYVLGGPGDARALIAGMYFWTWDTEEVLAMVEWMRRFNTSGRGRIEFTGFDMQTPTVAADIVRSWLGEHDPAWADSVKVAPRGQGRDPGFVTSTGELPAKEFAGHKVRYSGYVRTDSVSSFAGLWMRADVGEKRAGAFDNMAGQKVNGTRDWKRYSIDLDIPAETDNINFGVLMAGQGRAWFDSLAIEVDGRPWRSDEIDLALEDADGPRGLGRFAMHRRYAIVMDDSIATSGRRSLRLSGGPAAPDAANATGGPHVIEAARRLVQHMETLRRTPPAGTTAAQADWAARNAHVVLQHALMEARPTVNVRDSSMAANLQWIADEARQGSKVAIWAHNGHVAKQKGGMGDWLARRYGADMVVIGFAANDGQYSAIHPSGGLATDNVLKPGPAGSVESSAHATGIPRFLLDLRPARQDAAVSAALNSGATMRSIGAMAMDAQFHATAVLDSYDVLAWVDRTTPARPLGGTGVKLRAK